MGYVNFLVCTVNSRLMRNISTTEAVLGLTSVDDKLYVLLHRFDHQIAVYYTDNYQLLRRLNMPRLRASADCDLTSCARRKCLYLSDPHRSRIFRRQLAASFAARLKRIFGAHIREWPVSGKPNGLSVTPTRNLLVTCREPSRLVELRGSDGRWMRSRRLDWRVVDPWHGVQLASDRFVVCYADVRDRRCVSIVNDDGVVLFMGIMDDEPLVPCQMAVNPCSKFLYTCRTFSMRQLRCLSLCVAPNWSTRYQRSFIWITPPVGSTWARCSSAKTLSFGSSGRRFVTRSAIRAYRWQKITT